jgi:transposase
MPAPISLDLRRRIVDAVAGGSSMRAAARRFAVAPSTAIKLMRRVRETGDALPARYGGHRRPVLEPYQGELVALVTATPDSTLAELRAELGRRCGIEAALSTIHAMLGRLGLTHKKSR